MEEYRKFILDRFQEHLQHNFEHYCRLHGFDEHDNARLLNFIIDQGLIKPSNIQRYTLLKEFEQIDPELASHKTQAVNTLANRFSISERSVWGVLKGVKTDKK